ncbi:sulfatase family protein [Schlesneria sp.]|uniref:sulfatase family protein n=1 Tax=Schlesneria sp. TaxID=2762018 RepID=UPI002F151A29
MSRTTSLSSFGILLLTAFVFPCPSRSAEQPRRPNIVIIFADDWGRHAGAYARLDGPGTVNDVVRTPNFDRIAGEGVLFRRAFVSSPSCTPSRSALVSGQHFWRTGRGSMLRGEWDGSSPAFPLLLRDAGYRIGKSHKVWTPGTPSDAPFGGQQFAYEAEGRRFNNFSENASKLVAEGKTVEAAKAELFHEVRANFDAFLNNRGSDQPFTYWFGPTNVHRKWTKGSGKALWGLNPDDLAGKLPPFLPDVPEVREDLADYFGEIAALDGAIGLIVERLEQIGELDNTLLIISGDHGAPGFPHGKCNLYDFGTQVPLLVRWGGAPGGRVVDDLISLTDIAPSVLELAGLPIPEVMTGRSLVKILKGDKSGQVDPQRTAIYTGRERHVDSARAGYLPYPQRAIRTHDYLYIVNFRPDRWPLGDPHRLDGDQPPTVEEVTENTRITLADEDAGPTKAWLVSQRRSPHWKAHFDWVYGKRPREELYDLRQDPHQVKNVANDAEYANARVTLERQLLQELQQTGDPRLIDEGSYFETPPVGGPPVTPVDR